MQKPKLSANYESGKLLGLRVGPNGEPFINLVIENEDTGKIEMVDFWIDTGFNGYLQVTTDLIDKLELKVEGYSKTKLADGTEKIIGISKSKIKMLNLEITDFPIQIVEKGVFLLGTRFLGDLKEMLILDCSESYLTLTLDKKVKKKVRKTVDKYAR